MSKVRMSHILSNAKTKNATAILFEYSIVSVKLPEIDKKITKYRGQIASFLPRTRKLNWTLRPLFYIQVQTFCGILYIFISTFAFGREQKLYPKSLCSDFASLRNHIS